MSNGNKTVRVCYWKDDRSWSYKLSFEQAMKGGYEVMNVPVGFTVEQVGFAVVNKIQASELLKCVV